MAEGAANDMIEFVASFAAAGEEEVNEIEVDPEEDRSSCDSESSS
jgi:hypothetical protein